MRTVFSSPRLTWIDVINPTAAELNELAETHRFHPLLLQDCLEPEHLPKFERTAEFQFLILRCLDREAVRDAVTTQELTRKVAVFMKSGLIVTIHRAPLYFLEDIVSEIGTGADSQLTPTAVLADICRRAVETFEPTLEAAERTIENLESLVLDTSPTAVTMFDLHLVRRKMSCVKRLMWHTSNVVQKIPVPVEDAAAILFRDLRDTIDHIMFFADELLEDATSLMNLELSVSNHRTNEVIRVLTIFSVFFMPLTFVVGVYGMNFHNIPEFNWEHGYLFVWGLMLVITAGIAAWFRRRGWLHFH